MGIKLTSAAGTAQKQSIEQYKIKDGDNSVRIYGDLLARYIYWVKGQNNKTIPMECLSFDRDEEKFTNKEKDWVGEYYPDLKSSWAYSIMCIDPSDGKAKVFNLKKKLLGQIVEAAKELGDPCDLETGWDVHFTKKKTGPNVYNVEYTLNQIKCMKSVGPVSKEQRAAIEEATSIDELLPRPTPETQKEFLDKLASGGEETENTDEDISDEFDIS